VLGLQGRYGNEHRLVNETSETVVYLEVGDRSPGDEGLYPEIFISTKNFIGNVNFQPRSNAHELHD
jgi:uncharacterized cupin superfamily protein